MKLKKKELEGGKSKEKGLGKSPKKSVLLQILEDSNINLPMGRKLFTNPKGL